MPRPPDPRPPQPPYCLGPHCFSPQPGGAAGSYDPNEKFGAAGFGTQAFIDGDELIPYSVHFENLGPGSIPTPMNPATAPAQRIEVTDQLSTNLDWSTFEFTEFGFGDVIVPVIGLPAYQFVSVPVTANGLEFNVEVELTFDAETGKVRVLFQAIDPLTFLPPDVLTGILPPEDGTGNGKGYFNYRVRPVAGLASGTEIRNIALIKFDINPIIATNQIDPEDPAAGTDPGREALNTIDAAGPSSNVAPLPATTNETDFLVQWTGSDDTGGSGIAAYSVYVSDNGQPFSLWRDNVTVTQDTYSGVGGHTYRFYSVAIDHVGHVEAAPSNPDTQITVNAGACSGLDDHGNNSGLSTAVGVPSKTPGTIERNCDVDWFSFVASRGEHFTLATGLMTLADSELFVFAPDGTTQLAYDDDSGPGLASKINWRAPSSGTYYFRVQGKANTATGTYAVSLDRWAIYLGVDAPATLVNSDGTTIPVDDSDIVELQQWSGGGYAYRMFFDGSDVGLTTAAEDMDAFAMLDDGSLLISTSGSFSVPGPGGPITGNDEDLLRFVPTRTGSMTQGTWEFYFDGSDVGLTEDMDALDVLPDGRLVISSSASVSVPGTSGTDKDLFVFTPTTLGTNTAGTWQLYFSAVGTNLTTASEDIDALAIGLASPTMPHYFSTFGAFTGAGVSGGKSDLFHLEATAATAPISGTFSPTLDLTANLRGLGT
ncbi:MAG TPA: PPC domain-containing protein, partial [Pirellulaceae bacterium]